MVCDNKCHKNKCRDDKVPCDTVDYVVVGMGAAGCVLANRLSEDTRYSVMGLEAGDNQNDNPAVIDGGALSTTLLAQNYPQLFWQGYGVQQTQMLPNPPDPAASARDFQWTNGRVLGGGSTINGLIVIRGTPQYWDWVDGMLGGGTEWSSAKMEPRFINIENYDTPSYVTPSAGRGTTGEWSTAGRPTLPSDKNQFFLNILSAAYPTVPVIPDYNDWTDPDSSIFMSGVYNLQQDATIDYDREQTAIAFVGPTVMTPAGKGLNGRKLTVQLRSTATKLIFKDTNEVVGVEYLQDGVPKKVYANKQVILAAGFNSSAFLQYNGIGPQSVLENAGVEIRFPNEHVGRHLYNHPYHRFVMVVPGIDAQPNDPNEPQNNLFQLASMGLEDTTGALGLPPGVRGMLIAHIPFGVNNLVGFLITHGVPKSEGTVEIQSADPLTIPLVNQNYYSDEDDVTSMVAAIQLYATNMSAQGVVFSDPPLATIQDTGALTTWIKTKTNLIQAHHWCGTNRMGTSHLNGVCDVKGKVFGVQNLTVGDVSIIPRIVDGNLCTPTVAIAQTISEILISER